MNEYLASSYFKAIFGGDLCRFDEDLLFSSVFKGVPGCSGSHTGTDFNYKAASGGFILVAAPYSRCHAIVGSESKFVRPARFYVQRIHMIPPDIALLTRPLMWIRLRDLITVVCP